MGTAARHLTPDERMSAEEVLRKAPLAFVAVVENAAPDAVAPPPGAQGAPGGARPYVVPLNFAYEPAAAPAASADDAPAATPGTAPTSLGRLFFHTGPGRKTEALSGNPRVCIAVTADESFDQGASPCQDGFAFRSVLLEGRALLLEDQNQREQALRAIVAKYDPDAVEKPFKLQVFARTLIYVVEVETIAVRERPKRR